MQKQFRERQCGLQRAAEKVASDPNFLGHALASAAGGKLDISWISARFQIDDGAAIKLCLCRAPGEDIDAWARAIAPQFQTSAETLIATFREGIALQALRSAPVPSQSLLAARDRIEGADDPEGI